MVLDNPSYRHVFVVADGGVASKDVLKLKHQGL